MILVLSLMLAVCALGCHAAERPRPGSGAFLVYKAHSVGDLVQQIGANRLVAARFTRHFGVSTAALITYFQRNVRLATLKRPLRTTVYYILKNGSTVGRMHLLPSGAHIFATSDGRPILESECGNPMVKTLPSVQVTLPKTTPPLPAKPAQVAIVTEIPTVLVEAAPVLEMGLPSAPMPVLAAVAPTVAPVVAAVPAPPISLPPALMAAVPALIGVATVRSHSDVVPEPASLAVLAFGASGLALWHLRKKPRSARRS